MFIDLESEFQDLFHLSGSLIKQSDLNTIAYFKQDLHLYFSFENLSFQYLDHPPLNLY